MRSSKVSYREKLVFIEKNSAAFRKIYDLICYCNSKLIAFAAFTVHTYHGD